MPRLLLLHNPAARNAPGSKVLRGIEREIARAGFAVEAVPSERPGHLVELARGAAGDGFERVVVCGGDGSVREAAEGLFGGPVPLGVVPLGTVNVLASEMGLPSQDTLACAAVAGGGTPTPVGLGTVGGRTFTFSASSGFDALAVLRVSGPIKERMGAFAYGISGLGVLLEGEFPRLDVETEEGDRFQAWQVFAARARRYAGGGTVLSSRAGLRSPTMRLIALPAPFPRGLLALPKLFGEGLDGAPGIFCREVRAFRLRSECPIPLQADGDPMPGVKPEFRSHGGALRLVFPK